MEALKREIPDFLLTGQVEASVTDRHDKREINLYFLFLVHLSNRIGFILTLDLCHAAITGPCMFSVSVQLNAFLL